MSFENFAAVMVASDKNIDLVKVAVENFRRFYPECRKLYVVLNEADIKLNAEVIQTGPDKGWSESMIQALKSISEEFLFVILEDVIMVSKVDHNIVQNLLLTMKNLNIDHLHIKPVPKPQSVKSEYSIGIYDKSTPYQCNVLGLWKKETLKTLISQGESPWEFEVFGSLRMGRFAQAGCYLDSLFSTCHLVEKGKWVPGFKRLAKKNNLTIEPFARESLSIIGMSFAWLKKFIFHVSLNYLPIKLRITLASLVRRLLATY